MDNKKKLPQVITISGRMGSGKDTLATYIKEELTKVGCRVLITHYADLLKYILKQYFDWDGKKNDLGRWLLQHVGTDVFRNQYDESFWCSFVGVIIYLFGEKWDYVIIPDARFENEVESMKAWFDATSINVIRENIPEELSIHAEHESEHGLDEYEFDLTFENDKGLEEMKEYAKNVAGLVLFNRVSNDN